jgi:hypothetical protein
MIDLTKAFWEYSKSLGETALGGDSRALRVFDGIEWMFREKWP